MSNSPSAAQIAFSIPEFCVRNGISKSKYHKLKKEGRGPAEMRLGVLAVRITVEAERAWHVAMSNPSGEEAVLRAKMVEEAVQRGQRAGRLAVLSARHPSNAKQARCAVLRNAQELAAARLAAKTA